MSLLEVQYEEKKNTNKIVRFRTLLAAGFQVYSLPLSMQMYSLSIQLWMIRDLNQTYGIPFKSKAT